jgi:hypothetical protein
VPQEIEVADMLTSSQSEYDIRATALTNEFTWDEWTEVRHQYLCARHQARFHPEEWSARKGALPHAFQLLVESLREVIPQGARDRAPRLASLPPLDEIHTFMDEEIGRWLLHLTAQPAVWVRDSWESGLLPLLILRLLELEIDRRMGWNTDEPSSRRVTDASTSYGFDHWVPVESSEGTVEGLMEDVAYLLIAHDPDAVVTIESLDGSECYFAASKGLVIGENPLASPAQGATVRLRTWTSGLSGSVDLDAGNIDRVEDIAAERIVFRFPQTDALVRFVLLADGGEEAPLTWARWTADELTMRTGYVPDDDEYLVDDSEAWAESDTASESRTTDHERSLAVLRVEQPEWVSNRERSDDHVMLGEQAEWAYALPWMYRLIGADYPGAMMPRCPQPQDTVFDGPCGYWAALWELLCYNLGWTRPCLGLEWWLSTGQPVHDRKLRLLRDIWWADGQLDWFRAWLYENGPIGELASDKVDLSARLEQPSKEWLDRIRAEVRSSGFMASPFGGGSDPLHLRSHGRGPLKPSAGLQDVTTFHEAPNGELTLLLPGLGGWYSTLSATDHAGRVNVIVPWIGLIGAFSRSTSSGLWHSTTEDVHLAGNRLK